MSWIGWVVIGWLGLNALLVIYAAFYAKFHRGEHGDEQY